MRRRGILLPLLTALLLLTGCAANQSDGTLQTIEQLNDEKYTIAVESGTVTEEETKKLLPNANYVFVNSASDGYLALETNKADAYAGDSSTFASSQRSGLTGLRVLGEPLGESGNVAVGISHSAAVDDAEGLINSFLAEIKADGTLDDMVNRWVLNGDYEMPAIDVPSSPTMTIRVGTTGLLEPYTFYEGTELTGFDIEMIKRFALWANAAVEISTYDWAGLLPACTGGKVDYIISNLYETEERRQSVGFSEPYFRVETVIIVKDAASQQSNAPLENYDLENLRGKNIGVQVGSIYDQIVQQNIPEPEILYYNSRSDLVQSLEKGMIEAYIADRPTAIMVCKETPSLTYWDHIINEDSYGFAFPQSAEGRALCDEMSEFLIQQRENGALDALADKWLGNDEAAKTVPDIQNLSADNGTLRFAVESGAVPFVYVKDGGLVGYEVELAIKFCQEYGYGLEIMNMDFAALIPALSSGRCDMAASSISITPERAESVYFSAPDYLSGGTLMLRRENHTETTSFWESIVASFEKNFIRENRWQLIVQGIETTLLITILAALLGTALGFGICMLRRTRGFFPPWRGSMSV